ncbi:hypothetical protein HK100_008283 [Physocladia obscura]|uniref:Uncharacterized protein n=1 Tax=Physocladia obscura TaxID=109957 RepID=A0AAD5XI11_9FUNG|nr:hypothetical protein HK100_008283 [Physocladia obscura]
MPRQGLRASEAWAISNPGSNAGSYVFLPKLRFSHPKNSISKDSERVWERSPRKKRMQHKITQFSAEHWGDLFRFSYSVLPAVFIPSLWLAAWATLVCVFYLVPSVNFLKFIALPNSVLLVTVMGTSMSLLLVFRVNTAYDRFWEGRKVWGAVHFQLRNLGRLIWTYAPSDNTEDILRKQNAMNLLIGFATASKHSLRDEPNRKYDDLGPYLQHIPKFSPKLALPHDDPCLLSIPIEITFHLQGFVDNLPQDEFCDTIVAEITQLMNSEDTNGKNSLAWITPCSFEMEHISLDKLEYITSVAIETHRNATLEESVPNTADDGLIFNVLVSVEGMAAKLVGPGYIAFQTTPHGI